MKLTDIVREFNTALAGERLSYFQARPFLNRTIDDINAKLGAIFPVFSELEAGVDAYDLFPDRYIRTVVIPGAAWYYFTQDEEGIQTAPQYAADYDRGLFQMSRDYINYVPVAYQDTTLKALVFAKDLETGERGITVDGSSLVP